MCALFKGTSISRMCPPDLEGRSALDGIIPSPPIETWPFLTDRYSFMMQLGHFSKLFRNALPLILDEQGYFLGCFILEISFKKMLNSSDFVILNNFVCLEH